MKKTSLKNIYELVSEELLLEAGNDILIKKFGETEEVKKLVNLYWNDIRKRVAGTPKADMNFWMKKSFAEFKEFMDPYLSKLNLKDESEYKDMTPLEYYAVMPSEFVYDMERIPKVILSKLNYTEIYKDDNWFVVTPKDAEASVFFSKSSIGYDDGCAWCTGKNGMNNLFERYEGYGPQYIIIDKVEETKYNIQLSRPYDAGNKQTESNHYIFDYDKFPAAIFSAIFENHHRDNNDIVNFYEILKTRKYEHIDKIVIPDKVKKRLTDLTYEKLLYSENIEDVKKAIEYSKENTEEPILWANEALKRAAEYNRPDIAKYLIPISDCKVSDSQALRSFVRNKNMEMVKLLIPLSDCKARNSYALQIAVDNNDKKMVELLLPHSDATAEGSRCLRHAIDRGYTEIAKILIPHSDCKEYHSGALIKSVERGYTDLVEMLIPLSDCNVYDSEPLRTAAEYGKTEIVKMLIPHSDCKAVNSQAFRFAAHNQHAEIVKLLAPLSDVNEYDSVALRVAATRGHTEIVEILIPYSNCKADDSVALREAAVNGHTEIVELLIPHSDCKAKNSIAIRNAALHGYRKIVKMLIPFSDCKANKSEALRDAHLYKHIEIIEMLIPHSDPKVVKELGLDK